LPRIPDRDDLLRVGDYLAVGVGALGLLRSSCGSGFAFLCSAVRLRLIRD
jgi:hypothetical protein